jgi:cbb3-type cytochrome oxidase cytochrome c subunit
MLDQEIQMMLNMKDYAVIKSIKGRDVYLQDIAEEL